MINEFFNILILNTAAAETGVNWGAVIAGVLLIGLALLMFFKNRKK